MTYDIAIIGGGPAGMMAAARAGAKGARVILLEKNSDLGTKLLLTGGGRCNLTNDIPDPKDFVARLGKEAKFLLSALHQFGVRETLEFFHSRGLRTKVENNGRVFPVSDRAGDVLQVLIKELKKYQVAVRTKSQVKEIVVEDNKIVKLVLADGEEILARNFIIAAGGQSYPQVGATGDGYQWLAEMGHTIIPTRPSLTPLLVEEGFMKDLEGLSLGEAKLNLYQDAKKIISVTGDIVFTATGLSGPGAQDLSRYINPKDKKDLYLEIDFLAQLESSVLDKQLQEIFRAGKKLAKNSLAGLVPPKAVSVLLELAKIDSEKKSGEVSREERLALAKLLKKFKLKIKGLVGFDRAKVTAGGVALGEIDPRTMRSRMVSNLFVAGELLDLTGPTGGFNLQIAWTTGYVAGESAAGAI